MLSSTHHDEKEPINFSNPDDPRTKQYYQKFHAEMEASIAADIEIYRSLTNYIFDKVLERKQEDIDFEEAQRKAQEVIKVNTQLSEAAKAQSHDEQARVIDELKKTKNNLQEHIRLLETNKMQLIDNITKCKSHIQIASQQWIANRKTAMTQIGNAYEDIVNDPKKHQDGLISDASGKVLSKTEFMNLLDQTASSDLRAVTQALENNKEVADIKLNVITRISGMTQSSSEKAPLSEKEQLQIYVQAAKAENVIQHIRVLGEMGGGRDIPMIILMKREKLLGMLLARLSDSTLNQDIETFKQIHQKLDLLDHCQRKIDKTDGEIKQFKSLLSDVEESINRLEYNPDQRLKK